VKVEERNNALLLYQNGLLARNEVLVLYFSDPDICVWPYAFNYCAKSCFEDEKY